MSKPCQYAFKSNEDAEHISVQLRDYPFLEDIDWNINENVITIFNEDVHVNIKHLFSLL